MDWMTELLSGSEGIDKRYTESPSEICDLVVELICSDKRIAL
jgi:hypothetical protein